MANVGSSGYYGFKFVKTKDGSPMTGATKTFRAAAARGTGGDITIGTAVTLSSGTVVPMVGGQDCLGVVIGFSADPVSTQTLPSNLSKFDDPFALTLPTATAGTVTVAMADNSIFTVVAGNTLNTGTRAGVVGSTFDLGNAAADLNALSTHTIVGGKDQGSIFYQSTSPNNDLRILSYLDDSTDYPTITGNVAVGDVFEVQFERVVFGQA